MENKDIQRSLCFAHEAKIGSCNGIHVSNGTPEVGATDMADASQECCEETDKRNKIKRVAQEGVQFSQRKRKETATARELLTILESQNYLCAACSVELTPETSEIDHINPRADGGTDAPSNLQWLCKQCNRMKGTMSMAAFVSMCSRIACSARTKS